jgi:hypothetical protein
MAYSRSCLSAVSSTNAAIHRARAFRSKADAFDISLGSPPHGKALRAYQDRKPPRAPGATIAICANTDGPTVLRRVLGEDDHRRAIERERKRQWRAARSPDQIASYRARGREAARSRRMKLRL